MIKINSCGICVLVSLFILSCSLAPFSELHIAIERGSEADIIQIINDKPYLIKRVDEDNKTPLHWAIERDLTKIASLLIDKGSPVNSRDKYGNTALSEAVRYENLEVCTKLILKGADVNASTKGAFTPLHNACCSANIKLVKLLVDNKANINSLDYLGRTPLNLMLQNSTAGEPQLLPIVKYLLEKGTDFSLKDNKGRTALSVSKNKNYMTIVKLLESASINNLK